MNKKGFIGTFVAVVMALSMLMAVLPTASAATIEDNDKCRDLKALYVYTGDASWIYLRIDVNALYAGFNTATTKYCPGQPGGCANDGAHAPVAVGPYANIAAYQLYVDCVSGGQADAAGAADVEFGTENQAWDFNVQWDGSGNPWLQYSDWSGEGVTDWAVGIAAGTYEMRLNRANLEAKFGALGTVNVFVGAIKPGECYGQWGHNMHAFDPTDPGCPGEAAWGQCITNPGQAPIADRGTAAIPHGDYADIMTAGDINPPTGDWWSDWQSHFVGPCSTVDLSVSGSATITIDGNTDDWAGIAAAMSDPTDDTEAWSKDPAILGHGATAERFVGGYISPLDKLALLAPWIALAAIVATVSGVVYKKKIKTF